MKLEIGMYIRSPKGNIEKIDYLVKQDNPFWPYTINCTPRMVSDIKKASHNIIDLIEVGDYVNGYKVDYIDDNVRFKVFVTKLESGFTYGICDDDIKTILTHEIFEREAYKVE